MNNRSIFEGYRNQLRHPDADRFREAVDEFFDADAVINVVHPFNDLAGPEAYFDRFLSTLLDSFQGLFRRDYIAMSGRFGDQDWVTSTGYYVGHFHRPWLGIRPTGTLAYLRFGEFHRMENGQAVESFVFLDIPELMIAAGQWPKEIESPADIAGYTGYLPGPATQDGLLGTDSDMIVSQKSLTMVEDMLLGLATPDEKWRPYWHENMLWYGPAAFGSFVGVENFRAFQVPFEGRFSHWIGGSKPGSETRHFTRFADDHYVCSGGWPSLNAKQAKSFLGQPSKGKVLYMRVCDWWRREDDLLVENWVFVDIPHVLLQMDYDLFASLENLG